MNPYLLGIDVGTTRTAAAIARPGGPPEAVPLGERALDVPSTVALAEPVLVGEAAERAPHPVREFKRRVGDPTPIIAGERSVTPEQLCAVVVRWVVDEVARREGGPAERIAVTHPAAWGEHKLELLAGALADQGITAEFLAEPQAAAVHYATQERLHPGATVAVYDLGGGTFDAAVLQRDASGFSLLGRPEGLEHLGGVDFDQAVFDHVAEGAAAGFAGLDEGDPEVLDAVAALRRECAEAKEALSADTEVVVPVLLPGYQGSVRLTRGEFEEEIRSSVEETVRALRRAVESARVSPEALVGVLLVGGSSRIPLVPQLVSQELGRPVVVDAEPKFAVAKGAVEFLGAKGATAVQGTGEFETPPTGTGRWAGEAPTTYAPVEEAPTAYAPAPREPYGETAHFADPEARTVALPTDLQQTRYSSPPPPSGGMFDSFADYESDHPKGRSPVLVIGAGGLVAALAVVGAVAFWPSGPTAGNAADRSITTAGPTPEAPVATLPPTAEETQDDAPVRSTRARVVTTTTPAPVVEPVPDPVVTTSTPPPSVSSAPPSASTPPSVIPSSGDVPRVRP